MKSKVTIFLVIMGFPFIFGACKDDNPKTEPVDCCTVVFVSSGQDFTMFFPNAYTPNGDGLNDYLRINGDSTLGIRKVISFKASKASNGEVVKQIPVMVDQREGISNKWDFQNPGHDPFWGEFVVEFDVIDTNNVSHLIKTKISSFECPSISKFGEAHLNQCMFPDQVVPKSGFVQPTVEERCN